MSSIKALELNTAQQLIPKFEFFLDHIKNQGNKDRLISNYLGLEKAWSDYESFTVLYDEIEEEVLGFSALQLKGFPEGTARALTRTYYSPAIRERSLAGRKLPSLATKLMLPIQIKKAESLGIEHLFFSMQGLNRRAYFKKVINALNSILEQDDWILLEGVFNTCRPLPATGEVNHDKDCWQNIAYYNKKKSASSFSLPHISIDEYLGIYS